MLRLSLIAVGAVLLAGCQPPPPATTVTVDPGTGNAASVTTTPGSPPVALVPSATGTAAVVAGGS